MWEIRHALPRRHSVHQIRVFFQKEVSRLDIMSLTTGTDVAAASTKHTICGYAWGDVGNALIKAIANGDTNRAQRWAAELVCSETGLGRLEAQLFHAWATYVGVSQAPGWPQTWFKNIQHIRLIWSKSGGDIRTVRNTPSVRQAVAETVAWLVVAPKKALPPIPKPEDCFRESEAMRARLRSGGGSGDQVATRRVWVMGSDGADLKTIGNELEASLRTNQTARMLFWIVWLLTLDTQKECPPTKDRAPAEITGAKQRKSVAWFLVAIFQDLLDESQTLGGEDKTCLWGLLATTWSKLGTKGRRDVFVALAVFLQERCQKSLTLMVPPTPKPPFDEMRAAMATVDALYAEIAEEARRFVAETPHITGLTAEAANAVYTKKALPTSLDRLSVAYGLVHR